MVATLKAKFTREPAPLDLPQRWLAMAKEIGIEQDDVKRYAIRQEWVDAALSSGDALRLLEVGEVDHNLRPELARVIQERLLDVRQPLVEIDDTTQTALFRAMLAEPLQFMIPVQYNHLGNPIERAIPVPVATIAKGILDRWDRIRRTRANSAAGVADTADARAGLAAAAERARTIMRESNDWTTAVSGPLAAHAMFATDYFKDLAVNVVGAASPEILRDELLTLAAAERASHV